MNILELPCEILDNIINFLDIESKYFFSLTCSRINTFIQYPAPMLPKCIKDKNDIVEKINSINGHEKIFIEKHFFDDDFTKYVFSLNSIQSVFMNSSSKKVEISNNGNSKSKFIDLCLNKMNSSVIVSNEMNSLEYLRISNLNINLVSFHLNEPIFRLEYLVLNKVVDIDLINFSLIKNLRHLSISGSFMSNLYDVGNEFFNNIVVCDSLETLDIDTNITATNLNKLCKMENLKYLRLKHINNGVDLCMNRLNEMTQLKSLEMIMSDLNNNNTTFSNLSHLTNLTKLKLRSLLNPLDFNIIAPIFTSLTNLLSLNVYCCSDKTEEYRIDLPNLTRLEVLTFTSIIKPSNVSGSKNLKKLVMNSDVNDDVLNKLNCLEQCRMIIMEPIIIHSLRRIKILDIFVFFHITDWSFFENLPELFQLRLSGVYDSIVFDNNMVDAIKKNNSLRFVKIISNKIFYDFEKNKCILKNITEQMQDKYVSGQNQSSVRIRCINSSLIKNTIVYNVMKTDKFERLQPIIKSMGFDIDFVIIDDNTIIDNEFFLSTKYTAISENDDLYKLLDDEIDEGKEHNVTIGISSGYISGITFKIKKIKGKLYHYYINTIYDAMKSNKEKYNRISTVDICNEELSNILTKSNDYRSILKSNGFELFNSIYSNLLFKRLEESMMYESVLYRTIWKNGASLISLTYDNDRICADSMIY